MTLDEMRTILGLGPEVSDIDVVDAYTDYLDGELPPSEPLTLAEVKQHLKVEHAVDDDLITGMMNGAIRHLDGPHGYLLRSVRVTSRIRRLRAFPSCDLRLPYPPVIGITSIKYLDSAGVAQTLAAESYELNEGALRPAFGATWPSVPWRADAIEIAYVAGYPNLPEDLRAAILLMIQDLYRYRGTVADGNIGKVPMATSVENLLSGYRVYA